MEDTLIKIGRNGLPPIQINLHLLYTEGSLVLKVLVVIPQCSEGVVMVPSIGKEKKQVFKLQEI